MKIKNNNKKPKNSKQTIKKLLSYLFKKYKIMFFSVIALIVLSAFITTKEATFTGEVVEIIKNMVENNSTDFTPLYSLITKMIILFASGIASTYLYNLLMVYISQGILKQIRDEMFAKMQRLPISYFDTHTHGDIMSKYTNDTDSLEQMLCISVPQVISSILTVIFVFIFMLIISIYLTLVVIAFLVLMFFKRFSSFVFFLSFWSNKKWLDFESLIVC